MTTTTAASALDAGLTQRLSQGLVAFLETNTLPAGSMHPDVFCDLSLPQWRIQTTGADALNVYGAKAIRTSAVSRAGAPSPRRAASSSSSRNARRTHRARTGTRASFCARRSARAASRRFRFTARATGIAQHKPNTRARLPSVVRSVRRARGCQVNSDATAVAAVC